MNAPTAAQMIPWWQPAMTGLESQLIQSCLDENYINEGELSTQFEERIAELLGVKHVVCCTSGTSALFLAVAVHGIGHGDEVLVPDITFIASANAVKLAGATPVLVDIDPVTLTISVESCERAITRRTRAIMPVHVSGRGADMEAVMALAAKHNLVVIEDAAEALCSKHRERFLGTWGHCGCFSLSPNKTITTGQGGFVVTNDSALLPKLRELKDQGRPVKGTGGDDIHHSIGFNFKFTNLQAAVGLAQLSALSTRLERQRQIFRVYRDTLCDVPGIYLPPFAIDADGAVPQWTDAVVERRDELVAFLKERKIGCRPFWFPLHTQAPYRQSDERFPNASVIGPQSVWLPSAFSMTDAQQSFVVDSIKEFLC